MLTPSNWIAFKLIAPTYEFRGAAILRRNSFEFSILRQRCEIQHRQSDTIHTVEPIGGLPQLFRWDYRLICILEIQIDVEQENFEVRRASRFYVHFAGDT